MLARGKELGEPLWNEFSEDEIKERSAAMAQLGSVPAKSVEHLFVQFASDVANMTSCHGSFESTERLLEGILPNDKVQEIMEDIRGPHGRTMWDKLGNVSEQELASYMRKENTQKDAVIHQNRKGVRAGKEGIV